MSAKHPVWPNEKFRDKLMRAICRSTILLPRCRLLTANDFKQLDGKAR
jgi:hypothetical protein